MEENIRLSYQLQVQITHIRVHASRPAIDELYCQMQLYFDDSDIQYLHLSFPYTIWFITSH